MNYLILVLLLSVFGLYAFLRERSIERTLRAYESLIQSLSDDKKELLDRFFISKGHAPVGVDMRETHEKKEAERQETAKTKKVLRRGDPLQQERDKLVLQELSQHPELLS
jgi:hypothetical protein